MKFCVDHNGWYKLIAHYTSTDRRNQEMVFLDGECFASVFLHKEETEAEIVTVELTAGEHEIVLEHRGGDAVVEKITVEAAEAPAPVVPNTKLTNPNASPNAKKLMEFLGSIYGKKMLTSQHTKDFAMADVEYVKELTGKKPAVLGFELLGYSPNIQWNNYESDHTIFEAKNNRGTIQCAVDWAEKEHGIVAYCWHWFSPMCGSDKAFYTKHTDFDARKAVTPGTPEYDATIRDIDIISQHMKVFADKDIPILWRPLHEADGAWFWWGANGADACKKLWRLMYDRMVNVHHLNNLIWVWNSAEPDWWPGEDVVDLIGSDLYTQPGNNGCGKCEFDALKRLPGGKMIAQPECGVIPDAENTIKRGAPWLWAMTWCGEFAMDGKWNTVEQYKKLYSSEYALTLEDIQ